MRGIRNALLLTALVSIIWLASAERLAAEPTRVVEHEGSWILENSRLRVAVDPAKGAIRVVDRRAGREWRQPKSSTPCRNIRRKPEGPAGLVFEADFGWGDKRTTLTVTLTLPDDSSDLLVEADMADRNTPIGDIPFLEPFLQDTTDGALAVADYCNGHLYPIDERLPRTWFSACRIDMPWIGLCDMKTGAGCMIIVETSDDASIQCRRVELDGRKLAGTQLRWMPSKKTFRYPRRLIYHFSPRGGYVALAKRYRAHAKEQGLIVPFSEKLKKNPNISRLFGAPDVWGNAHLDFARQAKAAGVEKMLIHGRTDREEMEAVNRLGYLTSEYDNYTDIRPLEKDGKIGSNRDRLPDAAVLKADGSRMTAWLTFDKKTQFMKRCPSLWVRTAELVIPGVLEKHPFVGRFIDVTTAEGLYECYDPKHPLTNGEKRQCGVDLLSTVRSNGLVMGGEHGIWWAVPHLDYIEGMMSASYYPWPAGHLRRPKSKNEEFASPWGRKYSTWEQYDTWGIGHEFRVPLWELVFHDCIVSTWYWGDASDFLLEAAPEITPKKDAFNVLYGTIPLLWANAEGSWNKDRDLFLRTYRNTCKLHEAIAGAEMLAHEFLTADRAVQRTRFSDGTQAVVNFGDKPHSVQLDGRGYLLPKNGFAAKGPRIEQSLSLVDRSPVTSIQTPDYLFTDSGGVWRSLRRIDSESVRITVGPSSRTVGVSIEKLVSDWDPAGTRLFLFDGQSRRAASVPLVIEKGQIRLGLFPDGATLEAIRGSRAAKPDLRFEGNVTFSSARPKQGEPIELIATVRNGGGAAAESVDVAIYEGQVGPDRLLAKTTVSLAADAVKAVRVEIDTSPLDGARRILAVADPAGKVEELCELNNRAEGSLEVTPDFAIWPHRRKLTVESGPIQRENEPVVVPVDLPNADPASVRVSQCDGQGNPTTMVPAQFSTRAGSGRLCFLLTGKTAAGATRRFALLWADKKPGDGQPRFIAPAGTFWDPASATIRAETYTAKFRNGVLGDLAAIGAGRAGWPFISQLMLSSEATGWSDEPGKVTRFEVIEAGPVRTVIVVHKTLEAGVEYRKTYTFYPRRFDLDIWVNKPAGSVISRAYYLRSGEYADDKGNRATVDGRDAGENVIGHNDRPQWYAVYAKDWAHSCIALSRFGNLTYWDAAGLMGGIGFSGGPTTDARMSYVVHPGAANAAFARADHARLSTPPMVRFE